MKTQIIALIASLLLASSVFAAAAAPATTEHKDVKYPAPVASEEKMEEATKEEAKKEAHH